MRPTRLRAECSAPKDQYVSATFRVKHGTYLVVVHESLVSGRGHVEIGPSLLIVACGSAPLWSVSTFCLPVTGLPLATYLSFSSLTHDAVMYMSYQV
jgi:hypothetical protein